MFWFERQVVEALLPHADEGERAVVTDYVGEALADMPEPVRAGVAAESLLLGGWGRLQQLVGRFDPAELPARIERWETSAIGPLRQYVRLMRMLTLFAECELLPAR